MTKVRPMHREKPMSFELKTRTFISLLVPEKLYVSVGIRLDAELRIGERVKPNPDTLIQLAKRIMLEEKVDVEEGTGRLFSPIIFPGKFDEKKWNIDLIAQRLHDFNYVAGIDTIQTDESSDAFLVHGIRSKRYYFLAEYDPKLDKNLQRLFDRYEQQ